MSKTTCLNCAAKATGKYCEQCGRKTSTARLTLHNFFLHDIMHGVWHLEKGILFTLKRAFLGPGHTAVDYIKGRRVRYYNFFYLTLLMIGLNALVSHYLDGLLHVVPEHSKSDAEVNTLNLGHYIDVYFKLFLFALIPFFSLNGWIVFRRMRLNIAEHSLVAVNILLAGSIWYFLFNLCYYIDYSRSNIFSGVVIILSLTSMTLLPVQAYWQATKGVYKLPGFIWRIITWYVLLLSEALLVLSAIYLLSGKSQFLIS